MREVNNFEISENRSVGRHLIATTGKCCLFSFQPFPQTCVSNTVDRSVRGSITVQLVSCWCYRLGLNRISTYIK